MACLPIALPDSQTALVAFTVVDTADYVAATPMPVILRDTTASVCEATCSSMARSCRLYKFGSANNCTNCCWSLATPEHNAVLTSKTGMLIGVPITLRLVLAQENKEGVRLVIQLRNTSAGITSYTAYCPLESQLQCQPVSVPAPTNALQQYVAIQLPLPATDGTSLYTVRVRAQDGSGYYHFSPTTAVEARPREDEEGNPIYTWPISINGIICIDVVDYQGKPTGKRICKRTLPGQGYPRRLPYRCRELLRSFFTDPGRFTDDQWFARLQTACNERPTGAQRWSGLNSEGIADLAAFRAIGAIGIGNIDVWLNNDNPAANSPFNWEGVNLGLNYLGAIGELAPQHRLLRVNALPSGNLLLPWNESVAEQRFRTIWTRNQGHMQSQSPMLALIAATPNDSINAVVQALERVVEVRAGNIGVTNVIGQNQLYDNNNANPDGTILPGHWSVWISWRTLLEQARQRRDELQQPAPPSLSVWVLQALGFIYFSGLYILGR